MFWILRMSMCGPFACIPIAFMVRSSICCDHYVDFDHTTSQSTKSKHKVILQLKMWSFCLSLLFLKFVMQLNVVDAWIHLRLYQPLSWFDPRCVCCSGISPCTQLFYCFMCCCSFQFCWIGCVNSFTSVYIYKLYLIFVCWSYPLCILVGYLILQLFLSCCLYYNTSPHVS